MSRSDNDSPFRRFTNRLLGRDRAVAELRRQLQAAEQQISASETRLAATTGRLSDLVGRADQLRSRLSGTRRQRRRATPPPTGLNDQLDQLDRACNDLEAVFDAIAPAPRRDWRRTPPPLPPPYSRRLLWKAALWGSGAAAAAVFVAGLWLFWSLPNVSQLEKFASNLQIVVDKQGDNIQFREAIFNIQVSFEDMPQHLIDALLTREDRRFYEHHGVDFRGLGRAVVQNITNTGRGGGSTLTQQLAKNILFSSDRSMLRKIKEAALALKLELTLDKDKILEMYLNRIYFGRGTNGVETAARKYFNKRAKDLNVREAAILVGSIPSPQTRNYERHRERSLEYAESVLNDMEQRGVLPIPRNQVPPVQPGNRRLRTIDHIAVLDALRDDIRSIAIGRDGQFTIVTSIDPELQVYAELAVRRNMTGEGYQRGAGEAALVALAPDGAVVAMVGSVDRRRSTLNHVFDTRRQYGSVFKPIVYLTALEQGWQADNTISGAPLDINGYQPRNYDDNYPMVLTLNDALKRSVNTSVIRLQEQIGRDKVIDTARRLGLEADLPDMPGLALGVGEGTLADITAVYATFADGGLEVEPYLLVGIRDRQGNLLYWHPQPAMPRVIDEDEVAELNAMLADVAETGTGRASQRYLADHPLAGKTGTTQDYRDAWFVGFSAHLTAGVWVGNDDNAPMRNISGGDLPTRIWSDFMRNAHYADNLPVKPLFGND